MEIRMKAGKTDFEVRTRVRVTHIASSDPDDLKMVGMEGEITHPFPGLMIGSASKYIAGLHVDAEEAKAHGVGLMPLGGASVNLCRGDRVEVVEPA